MESPVRKRVVPITPINRMKREVNQLNLIKVRQGTPTDEIQNIEAHIGYIKLCREVWPDKLFGLTRARRDTVITSLDHGGCVWHPDTQVDLAKFDVKEWGERGRTGGT